MQGEGALGARVEVATAGDYVVRLRRAVGRELLLLPGVVGIVHDARGWVLLHRRRDDNQWGPPGGAIDPGESPAQAVVREVREETGLRVIGERLLGVLGGARYRHEYPNGDRTEATIVVFGCRVVGGRLERETHESMEIDYFPPSRLPPLVAAYPPVMFAPPPYPAEPFFDREG